MSHLLWKYYWDNDVDKFRRLLAPLGAQTPSKGNGVGSIPLGPSSVENSTSPRAAPKSRKASTNGSGFPNPRPSTTALSKAELNARDHAGLTVLLRASSSTHPNAILYVHALLEQPTLDLYVQDPESGWNALHRSLYAGNISIARLLLEQERKNLSGDIPRSSSSTFRLLIKTKDHEGNSPFDLYNSTIAPRESTVSSNADDTDSLSGTVDSSQESPHQNSTSSGDVSLLHGDELFMFGSNKNLSLGVGDEDDRQFPERIHLTRPTHLLRRYFEEYSLERDANPASTRCDTFNLQEVPALIRARPVVICDVVLSKLHSAILTSDPVSNLYVCGVGRGGRLGLGDENTRFRFLPIQGALADKKVLRIALGQNHTMAIVEHGELWTWGSNNFSQLGYSLPPPARPDEEPISTNPRQIFGALRKEAILGIAASAVHSVAHTGSSLFCWGRNLGQLALMDSDSRSLKVQETPRKVAASLFSSPIEMVSTIDKATTCLLANHTVCVFTSYGYNIIKFPLPDVFANTLLRMAKTPSYSSANHTIKHIASGGETIAAISSRGDLFVMNLSDQSGTNTPESSTTNPAKIRGAVSQPKCVWSARKDGVASVGVGEHGSVIICTESGAVWRRIRRAKPLGATILGSLDIKQKDFKFQRVPNITDVVAVRSSTFGAFAAIRKDCQVMKEQIKVKKQTLWNDLSTLLSINDFVASEPTSKPKGHRQSSDGELRDNVGNLPYQVLKSPDLESELKNYLATHRIGDNDYDAEVCTSRIPDLTIPVHGFILGARSTVLRAAFSEARCQGVSKVQDIASIRRSDSGLILTFHDIDLISVLNIIVFAYHDEVIPAWNYARQAPPLANRYRQVRSELMKASMKLNMLKLEAAVRLQTQNTRSLDEDFRSAVADDTFFEDADTTLDLDGGVTSAHSELVCQRCPFFQGFFKGRSKGQWLAGRRKMVDTSDKIRIDLTDANPAAFRYVRAHLYADIGLNLFDDTVTSDADEFFDLVTDVLNIANELMLDRLSQICQNILGRFVTTRNIAHLLNEISPCSVTEFKDAGLEYICLQMETMLENHLLDDLDEELLLDLDEAVRHNQYIRHPIARGRQADVDLYEKYPHLIGDIEEERRRRTRDMSWRAICKDENRRLLAASKTRFGSLDDPSSFSPSSEKTQRMSKAERPEQTPAILRTRNSQTDLIFDMDEEESDVPSLGSPCPQVDDVRRLARSTPPPLSLSITAPKGKSASALEADQAAASPSRADLLSQPQVRPLHPLLGEPLDQVSPSNPWRSTTLPTQRLGLREIMSEASGKPAPSDHNTAQGPKDGTPKSTQSKISQKERKKQQQQQQAAFITPNSSAANDPSHGVVSALAIAKAAPWKSIPPRPKAAMKDMSRSEGSTHSQTPDSVFTQGGAARTSVSHRTASPDTRFAGQGRGGSSPSLPTPSRNNKSGREPIMPYSKNYITTERKAEPSSALSLADIIVQQKREQDMVKEAVARRSLQEIQQEQAFQEWWDQESRRTQEEEARRVAREKGKERKRGRSGRGRKMRGGGILVSASASVSASEPSTQGAASPGRNKVPSHGG